MENEKDLLRAKPRDWGWRKGLQKVRPMGKRTDLGKQMETY
jgi:hypothetical protein